MSFLTLPIIDLKDDETTIIRSIFHACSTTGFFYLRNHSLLAAQESMLSLSKQYFHLPIEIKKKHLINNENFGYVELGEENLDSKKVEQMDVKESFNFKKVLSPDELPSLFAESDNFQLITSFHRSCYELCMQLLTYLAKSFEIDDDYFTSKHRWETETGEILRIIHYPSVKKQGESVRSTIRTGAHSDYGSISLLFQHEHVSGLEILDRSNNIWYPVVAHDDMIVVNFGDACEYWSKGLIRSIVHRVSMLETDGEENRERYSMVYFAHPTLSALLTPIPSKIIADRRFEKDEHAKHALDHNNEKELTAGEHLFMRLKKTHILFQEN